MKNFGRVALLAAFVAAITASSASAVLVVTNGDFEGGIPDEVHQIDVGAPWFDYDNDDGTSFWENAWQISVDAVSPTDSGVLALSAFAADETLDGAGLNGYAYQSIGTADGADSVTLGFDWGSFDDAPGPRDMGVTFTILEDATGSAVSDEQTDILGQAGLVVVDSMSASQLGVPISGIFSEEWTFDLTSAGGGDLYLRINNWEPAGNTDQAWVFVDNVRQVPEPAAAGLIGLMGLLGVRRRVS